MVVHDAGVLINPVLAEGQIVGGVCQGLGGALLEEMLHDRDAQLLVASLADYLIPTASDMPLIEELGSRMIEDLIELPLMSDPASLATMDVLTKIGPPSLSLGSTL